MASNIDTLAIVQARLNSTRLPNKVVADICGKPLIERLLARLAAAHQVSEVVVAIPDTPSEDRLEAIVRQIGFPVVRGPERDVLARFNLAASMWSPRNVVRITADCPLIDPGLVDFIIERHRESGAGYTSNTLNPTYPDGLDVEVFSLATLDFAHRQARTPYEREHVTPFMKSSPNVTRESVENACDLSAARWTVDEPEDLLLIRSVYAHFSEDHLFAWKQVVDLEMDETAAITQLPQTSRRDEGSSMNTGQKLWRRAKRVIPGGNMLLSKRPEMFLPDKWPAYFDTASGCTVIDLDGNALTDVSLMGVGTNTLGYGQPDVDAAVHTVINKGNMSTLNCPEEVALAERLVSMHPWADMVRLARTGGEANAIATRIGRAASSRDGVAVCGYHGWHDWYLAANLSGDENLAGHLLPGLEPRGVPTSLRGSVFPFRFGDLAALTQLVHEESIGVICMEVRRNLPPDVEFLSEVRTLANRHGIVLIFDECTSGFRETFGGLHLKYGVEPDIAVFGKALGNGYAITAVVGRKSVMESAQSTFVSSTFWTERIGPAAALATLDVMEETKSWETITQTGELVISEWERLAKKHSIKISTFGLPALATFAFDGPDTLYLKTLLTQEMLKRGYLATTCFYASTPHTGDVVSRYLTALDEVFELISKCAQDQEVQALLEGPPCHSGFGRLN